MATKGIDEVLKEHSNTLMSIPDVVGTGHDLCGKLAPASEPSGMAFSFCFHHGLLEFDSRK